MITIPENLQYTETHEWVDIADSDSATVGLTDYAQKAMGDVVFVAIPEVGDEVIAGESFTDLESVKAVSDVYAPVSGTISAVNEALLDEPGLINADPYGAWVIKVSPYTADGELLDATAYSEIAIEEDA